MLKWDAAGALEEAVRRAIPAGERAAAGWRVALVLDELEAPPEMRQRPVRALSGDWQPTPEGWENIVEHLTRVIRGAEEREDVC